MFENPRSSKLARNFTTNVPKILDLKSSSEQIFFRKLSLGAPAKIANVSSLNECHKIDTSSRARKTEHMRSRQNVPGPFKMASKP